MSIVSARLLPAFVREAGARQWRFTLRTFAASMAALYLAFQLGLDQPKWAMMTVYIVAQPLGGMVLAKGLYRLIGSLVGAAMALLLIGVFAQQHGLFLVVMASWLGLCTFCASLLRNFRAYGFVLAGYSALIVGLPGVLQPDLAFTEAIARVTEIGLGIFCAALASMLVWPASAGQAYLSSARGQFNALLRLVADCAAGRVETDQLHERRRALLTAGMALEGLREHALFDSAQLRRRAGLCRRLGHEMLAMVSSVGALQVYVHRYGELRRDTRLRALLEGMATLTPEADTPELREQLSVLYARARTLAHALRHRDALGRRGSADAGSTEREHEFYAQQLALEHIGELCDRLRSSVVLLAMLTRQAPLSPWRSGTSRLHLDYAAALHNGARAALVIAVGVLVWFWSGSAQGPQIVIMAGIVCALFSTRDNPVAAAGGFIKGAVVAALAALLYRLVLLPGAEGFAALLWWLAPIYLLAGLAIQQPASAAVGTAVAIFFPVLLDLGPSQDFSALPLFNSILGLVVGMMLPVLAFLLLWPSEDAATARTRLCRDLCHTLGRWPMRRPRHQLETLLYDRLTRTLPILRVDPVRAEQAPDNELLRGAMTTVVLGLGLLYLDALCRRGVPPAVRTDIQQLIHNTQRTLLTGDAERWHTVSDQAETVLKVCQDAYRQADNDGQRRRLVRAVVRLRMQVNIINEHLGFLLAGSGVQEWRGLSMLSCRMLPRVTEPNA